MTRLALECSCAPFFSSVLPISVVCDANQILIEVDRDTRDGDFAGPEYGPPSGRIFASWTLRCNGMARLDSGAEPCLGQSWQHWATQLRLLCLPRVSCFRSSR